MKRLLICLTAFALFVPAYGFGAEPIRLGILYDQSGAASYYSAFQVKNIELAVAEINEGGGILGRKIEILKEDDGNDPNVAPLRTRTLIKRGAVALILSSASASAIQARVVAEEEKVPAFCTNTSDRIAQPPNNTYVFQVMNSASQQMKVLLNGIRSQFKQIAIFTDSSPTGAGAGNQFKKALEDAGVEVLAVEALDVGATDAIAVVTRLRDKWQAKAVMVTGQAPPEQALFIRTVRQVGWNVQIFQDITATTPSYKILLGPRGLENIMYMEMFDPSNELAQKMLRKFTAKYPNEPFSTSSAVSWNAVYMLKEAIEKSKTTDGPVLRDAIEKVCGMRSHYGPPTSTVCCSKENHLCTDPDGIFIATFKDGKTVPVRK